MGSEPPGGELLPLGPTGSSDDHPPAPRATCTRGRAGVESVDRFVLPCCPTTPTTPDHPGHWEPRLEVVRGLAGTKSTETAPTPPKGRFRRLGTVVEVPLRGPRPYP